MKTRKKTVRRPRSKKTSVAQTDPQSTRKAFPVSPLVSPLINSVPPVASLTTQPIGNASQVAPCRFKCRLTRKFELTVRNPLGGEAKKVPLEEALLFSLEDGQEIGCETFGVNEEIRITTPRPGTFRIGEEYTIDIRKRATQCTTPTVPHSAKATAFSSPASSRV